MALFPLRGLIRARLYPLISIQPDLACGQTGYHSSGSHSKQFEHCCPKQYLSLAWLAKCLAKQEGLALLPTDVQAWVLGGLKTQGVPKLRSSCQEWLH